MINIDDINVGDLISRQSMYDGCVLGYVVQVIKNRIGGTVWCNWSNGSKEYEGYVTVDYLTGHWKVINFEEENKVKKLDGTVKLNMLLNGKELQKVGTDTVYQLMDGQVNHKNASTKGEYIKSKLTINDLLTLDFVEYKEPIKVGDWVKATSVVGTYVGQVTEVTESFVRGYWNGKDVEGLLNFDWNYRVFEIMTPEEVKAYKLLQVFTKLGRKLYEYKSLDIVMLQGELYSVDYTPAPGVVRVNSMEKCTVVSHNVKAIDLTPVYFVENMVKVED